MANSARARLVAMSVERMVRNDWNALEAILDAVDAWETFHPASDRYAVGKYFSGSTPIAVKRLVCDVTAAYLTRKANAAQLVRLSH